MNELENNTNNRLSWPSSYSLLQWWAFFLAGYEMGEGMMMIVLERVYCPRDRTYHLEKRISLAMVTLFHLVTCSTRISSYFAFLFSSSRQLGKLLIILFLSPRPRSGIRGARNHDTLLMPLTSYCVITVLSFRHFVCVVLIVILS